MRLEGCVQYKAGSTFNVCFHKHLAYHAWQVSLPQNKQQNPNTLASSFPVCRLGMLSSFPACGLLLSEACTQTFSNVILISHSLLVKRNFADVICLEICSRAVQFVPTRASHGHVHNLVSFH